jgi:hypothetical protein
MTHNPLFRIIRKKNILTFLSVYNFPGFPQAELRQRPILVNFADNAITLLEYSFFRTEQNKYFIIFRLQHTLLILTEIHIKVIT